MMTELEVTIKYRYVVDPEHYGTDIPEEMAAVDLWNYREYPEEMFDQMLERYEFTITVEPVK